MSKGATTKRPSDSISSQTDWFLLKGFHHWLWFILFRTNGSFKPLTQISFIHKRLCNMSPTGFVVDDGFSYPRNDQIPHPSHQREGCSPEIQRIDTRNYHSLILIFEILISGFHVQFPGRVIFMSLINYPKTPWDVMGCQNHLFGGPRGVTRRVWCFHRRGREP